MTKKELEKKCDYLILQLKKIHELINDPEIYNNTFEASNIRAEISYITKSDTIRDHINYIIENDWNYNFYNKDMNIEDYQ